MRLLSIVGALALALLTAVPLQAAPTCEPDVWHKIQARTTFDPGGYLEDYKAFVRHAHRSPRPVRVEIRGECYSACGVKLSAPDVCVSRDAIIGIHEVRTVKNACAGYRGSQRDEEGTADYAAHMPACAARLFQSRNAFASSNLTNFRGQEILDACPQIKVCK